MSEPGREPASEKRQERGEREERGRPVPGATAGFASRFVAMVVDLMVIVGTEAAAVVFIASLGVVLPTWVPAFIRHNRGTVAIVLSALYVMLYFVIFWTWAGRTPGKIFMGLEVTGPDGRKPRLGRSFVRFVGYLLSSIPVYLGFVWVMFDNHRLGWHDHVAHTRVAYKLLEDRSAEPAEPADMVSARGA